MRRLLPGLVPWLAAAFWLTMAATPEGAQGQVTVQVVVLLPQPASRLRDMTSARDKLSRRFFIISFSSFIQF